jgi:HSP20 family protein
MAEKTEMAPREGQRLARRESTSTFADPFRTLDRFADEMDRIFDNFGFGRGWIAPRTSQWLATPSRGAGASWWAPDIEVYQRNNELVVRADLPGLKKEDVKVDVTDHAIAIQGERRQEEESERGGVYRSERSYGSFYRTIPLPEGAMTDQAKANFKDGVLEITMPAPPDQVTRGRRLEIKESAETKK